jgi:long-chain fatty acid transport protein
MGLATSTANAAVTQTFWGNNFNNPAMMNATKNQSYTLGTIAARSMFNYWGTGASGVVGNASSNEATLLPYFNAAVRVNPKWVVGLNVSQPYWGYNQVYGVNATTLYDVTNFQQDTTDFSPQVSYQATPTLALGAGLDILQTRQLTLNFVPFGVPTAGETTNTGSAWSLGWNAGLFYTPTQRDFISLYYYSKQSPTFNGTSENVTGTNTNFNVRGLHYPATTVANYIRMLTDKWLGSIKVNYTQWSINHQVNMNNVMTSGNLAFPAKMSNTLGITLFTKYNITEKYAIMGGALRESSALRNNTRTIAFNNPRVLAAFGGGAVNLTKEITLQGVVGYATYRNTPIRNPFGYPTNGHLNAGVPFADVSLAYNI